MFARLFICLLTGSLVARTLTAGTLAAESLADDWRQEYSATDAQASHVIALWQFQEGKELEDSSKHGHTLTLHGAKTTPDGKFGVGLQSFPGWPIEDKRHAAVAAAHPSLSPDGPFTIDMWLKPAANLPERGLCYLLCKKYVSNNDYQLLLPPVEGSKRRLQLVLGFGADSEAFSSNPVDWPADIWQHVAVTYDGAGSVNFYRNGARIGGRVSAARKSISPGPLPLSIGDRTGSNYGGFAGVLDQVRISKGVREFSPLKLEFTAERSTYVRMEPAPKFLLTLRNLQSTPLGDVQLTLTGSGTPRTLAIQTLEAGASHTVSVPFDTSLRPDVYELRALAEVPGTPPMFSEDTLRVTLVPRPLPYRMPVMMWGIGSPSSVREELPRLKALGFTHCLGFGADYSAIWEAGKPIPANTPATIAATHEMLDIALANDFAIGATLYAGYFLKQRPELARVDREGKPYKRHDCNASMPGLVEFCQNVGQSVGQTYGHHPAFQAALVNSEVRDDSQVSFSAFDQEAYRKFAGRDIPEQVVSKSGVSWNTIKGFPANRVLPDDDPLLAYYRWFWTVGDGWNGLHSALDRGLKTSGRQDIWTWYDPSIRVPSIAGSGGEVDVLSQWTYTEPSSLRVGYFADELFAMAALSPKKQRVMKMTQLFWYRSTSAPIGKGANRVTSPFEDHDPDAAYISIAPMHLRESFWTKLARPVSGLMYHGWSSLVPTDGTHAYKFTQPDLQTEFRRLHRDVLEPLGPTLLQVPDRRSDVAYLESFTSQMFAHRGSYGYYNDEAYLTLLHAQLQPAVVYEQTIQRQGLDGYRILVLMDCDVLPESVATRILEFQSKGGLIIGDANLAPAIKPDMILPRYTRSKKAAADKAMLLANAAKLRATLDSLYQRPVESTNPEIVTRLRTARSSDYVFVVNDRREAGDYVGQHGLVQDIGLPSDGELRLRRESGHVYDLTARRAVQASAHDGQLVWPVMLGPCDGNVFLVTERPIEQILIETPDDVPLGKSCDCRVTVADADGKAVDAVIPLRVEILDPHGRPAEFTGYFGADLGRLECTLDFASNDSFGVWTIRVQELASGLTKNRYVRVSRP
jgi:hypothetical protein